MGEIAAPDRSDPPARGKLDLSVVVTRTAQIYWAHAGVLIIPAIVINGLPGLVGDPAVAGDSLPVAILTTLFSFLASFWYAGFVVDLVRRHASGDEVVFSEVFGRVLPMTPTIIGASLLAVICVMLGFVALIVPGIFLLIRLTFVVPAVVVDRASVTESLERSSQVVKGNFWWVVLLFVVLFFAGIALAGGIGMIVGAASAAPAIAGFVVASLIGPLFVIPIGVAYLQLTGRLSAPPPLATVA